MPKIRNQEEVNSPWIRIGKGFESTPKSEGPKNWGEKIRNYSKAKCTGS